MPVEKLDARAITEIRTLKDRKTKRVTEIVGKHGKRKVSQCLHCGSWFKGAVFPSAYCSERCYDSERFNQYHTPGYVNPYTHERGRLAPR